MPARPARLCRPPVWAGALLAGLLVLAQGWGLWHRVAHGTAGAVAASALAARGGTTAAAPVAPPAAGVAADTWFGHAAGAHGGLDCLWFDHLACGDGAPAAAALAPVAEALPDTAPWPPVAAPGSGPRAAFHARGPPAPRAA